MLEPIGDRIIVRPQEVEGISEGGIVLPDSAQKRPQRGVVIACGKGRLMDNGKRIAMSLQEGDCIIYSKYGGTEIKHRGQEFIILSETDVFAIVRE